ncbi:hypothetical protein V7S43_015381 [Phytophthora oleae]|uniref:FYVE-type domain-containing protein n=1 Tax=Phytophthora oleae TaxID=2107226 RepID=A0ABD3F143_9STRA
MRLPLPVDFFAPVRLSPAEAHDLQLVEKHLLASYLSSYDAQATAGWKLVGQRAGVRIFSQRPKKEKTKRPRSNQSEPERESTTIGRDLPALRLVGSVDGTLEDVLYGSMWRSGRERAARAHFTGDGVADGSVLCSVESPSSADPFRSLSVKWALRRAPHGGLVVKDRDFCYLAASGVVYSPRTGVKLGYRLRHSITFPSCPPFQNHSVVRGQIFLCSFFRQLRNGRVEVFHEGKYDVGGRNGAIKLGVPKSIAEKSIVETLLSLEDVRACALAKKLARAVENTEAERAIASLSSTSVQESLDGERRCGMCLRRLGNTLKRRCAACRHWTCAQCSVRQETVPSARIPWAKGPVSPRCFCKACVAKVLHEDASQFASRDAVEVDYEVTSGRWGHDDIPEEDEGEDEEVVVPSRRHSMVLFSGNTQHSVAGDLSRQRRLMTVATGVPSCTELGSRTSVSRLSAKQISVDSDAMNTVNSSPPDNRRRRSATLSSAPVPVTEDQNEDRARPIRRLSMNAPDILLRSDVGRRNWASSTSALSLQSPQRHIDGSPIVNINRRRRSGSVSPSVHRVSFGSNCSSGGKSDEVRVRIVTPKRSQPAAAYTPYFASAGVSSRRASVDHGPPSIRTVHNQFFRDLYSNQNPARR